MRVPAGLSLGQVQDGEARWRSTDDFLPGQRRFGRDERGAIMRRFLKWTLLVVVVLAAGAFLAFLYFMPPFFLIAPEQFGKDMAAAPPAVSDIADPAVRAIAERGRY